MQRGGYDLQTPTKHSDSRKRAATNQSASPTPLRSSSQRPASLYRSASSYRATRAHNAKSSETYPHLHHPFPSPPSSTASPVAYLEAYVETSYLRDGNLDPWQETAATYLPRPPFHHSMSLPVAITDGMDASWRAEGSTYMDRGESNSSDLGHAGLTAARDDPFGTDEKASAARSHLYFEPSSKSHSVKRVTETVVVGPLSIAVLASMMDTSKGRDKVLKIAQYSLRTYLYILGLIAAVRPLSPWFRANSKRMRLAVSGLSLTRKCLLLLNPLHPLTHLLSPNPASATSIIGHLIDLASAISDDLYCLSRLGIVGKRLGKRADRWANRFWLLNTLIGLYRLHLSTVPRLKSQAARNQDLDKAQEIRAELSAAHWTGRKLLADLVFVSYDVLKLTWFEEPVKCAAGLLAAFISSNKLYEQQWRASLGKG